MKIEISHKYIKVTIFLLFLLAGCATKPGIRNREDVNVWADKAIQAGCNDLSLAMMVSTADSATANAIVQMMRKLGVQGSAEKQLTALLSNPKNESILVLSKINNNALNVVENLIKQWQGITPSSMLCVFAQSDRAENLHQLAQEKGFNLHIIPLDAVQISTEGE